MIQELIKNVAETHPLDQHPFKGLIMFNSIIIKYKFCFVLYVVIVLQEVDRLSKDAQDALRRTMEKYISSCRLILCALSTSRVTPAIQSRCLPIRVAAPTNQQIVKGLQVTYNIYFYHLLLRSKNCCLIFFVHTECFKKRRNNTSSRSG